MQTSLSLTVIVGALIVSSATVGRAEGPPRGGGAGGRGRGGVETAPAVPAVPQIARNPPVDQAAHDRGRALWATHCVTCHGTQARGSETGPNIIRTRTVNFDRSAQQA